LHKQKVLDLLVLCIIINLLYVLNVFTVMIVTIDCWLTLVSCTFQPMVALINHLLTYLLTTRMQASGQLTDTAAYVAVSGRHGRQLACTTWHQKSESVNWCIFTWRTILLNFTPIWFETTEPWAFSNSVDPTTTTRRRRTG